MYIATAKIKQVISVTAVVKNKITAVVKLNTLNPSCPLYDLIDGGTPSTIYVPINGFNLIDGNG